MAQLANYALVGVLAVLTASLMLTVVEAYATQTAAKGAAILTVDALDMLLVAGLVLLLLRQVMPIAARLGGGVALASFGVASGVLGHGAAAVRGGGAYRGRSLLDRMAIGYESWRMRGRFGWRTVGGPVARRCTSRVTPVWRTRGRGESDVEIESSSDFGVWVVVAMSGVLAGCAGSDARLPECRGTAVPINPESRRHRRAVRRRAEAVRSPAPWQRERTMASEPEVAAYLEAARGWDLDRAQAAERSSRRAWRVAAVALLLTALALVAVAALTPLKSVEPFVIRVDNATGVVDVVPVATSSAEIPEAVTRYLVTQYVQARERYVGALAESDYEKVGAYHAPAMNQAWAAAWSRNNPDSPLNRYADGTTMRVQVRAVSFLSPASGRGDLAQVRFLTARQRGGQGTEQVTPLRGDAAVRLRGAVEGRPAAGGESARLQGARVPPGARGARSGA